jgi:glycosyltransferase involved in cell wall biosynthesis
MSANAAVDPLTVLHLAANRWWTGSADPVIRLVVALRQRGHQALLGMIPGDRFEAKAREAGLDPVAGLHLRASGAPLALARDVRRIRTVVAQEGVDLIHAHHSHDHWLAVLSRTRGWRGTRVPVVRTVHSLRSLRRSLPARALYRRTAAVFAVSRQIEVRCLELGLAPSRVWWIPGMADLPRFSPEDNGQDIRDEFGLGAAPVVATVSRLAPNRGHELLLAGFRLLAARLPAARLLLVGKGETRARLEGLVQDLGLGGHVIFTGYRDRDLPAVLGAADCFALMAAGSDDSCRAALEAMAAGRPVVARRVGALPETVAHGETGWLIDDERPESVADALEAILGDRAAGRAMGRAGRQRVERDFSAERAVSIVDEVYRSLV